MLKLKFTFCVVWIRFIENNKNNKNYYYFVITHDKKCHLKFFFFLIKLYTRLAQAKTKEKMRYNTFCTDNKYLLIMNKIICILNYSQFVQPTFGILFS